jgi:adenylylsulfate kinase
MTIDVTGVQTCALPIFKNFTGVQDPYEEPLNPDMVIDTQKEDLDTVIKKIISKLQDFQEVRIVK